MRNVWPTAVQLCTHQTLRQQGGTGKDGHIHLADCMDSQRSGDREEEDEVFRVSMLSFALTYLHG